MANPMFAARYKISYNEGVQTIPVHADFGHMRGFFILTSSWRDKREYLSAIAPQ
ncbi:hypothetical protein N9480_03685 [Planktomarina temperata]|nr:hypothetical protein [Planktomarina temperata]